MYHSNMNQEISRKVPSVTVERAAPALLFEMMRSFVVLARTLNLSQATAELKSTRQTVRRHIVQLEEEIGSALFVVSERQYALTEAGENALSDAQDLVAQATVWSRGQSTQFKGLHRIALEKPDGWVFHQQQQSLDIIWDGASALLREALVAWSKSGGYLEHEAFEPLRPYVLVYRESPHGWICVEVGEKSFYALWYGWINARSSIGRPLGQFPGGDDVARLLNRPFEEIKDTSGARLDEVVSTIAREPGGAPVPTAYKRLLLGSRFPDGSFALLAFVDRSEKIRINGVSQEMLERMPKDAVTSFVAASV